MTTKRQPGACCKAFATFLVYALLLSGCGKTEPATTPVQSPAVPAQTGEAPASPSEIIRSPGESVAQLAKRVIPAEATLAFDATEVVCCAAGSNIVILFRNDDSLSNYTGWVLHPAESAKDRYVKNALPAMDEAAGLFDITVKTIFAAEAGRKTGPELVVLYQYYRTGSGTDEGYASYVYEWTGHSFEVDAPATASVVGLKTENEVRAKLALQAR